jgi:hypothetical protein
MAFNQFHKSIGIGPLHYLLSNSYFGCEFAEIFEFDNRLPDSLSNVFFTFSGTAV